MKHLFLFLTLTAAALSGCLSSDSDADDLAVGEAVSALPSFLNVQPASVTGLDPLGQLLNADGESVNGAGIWPYGDYVFGAGLGGGFWIADISNPANATMLFQSPEDSETAFARDADVVAHPDGRLTLVLATQSDGMHIWDVTRPTEPVFRARIEVDPNHNVATIPGTTYVFNSQSGGWGRSNDLVDLTDPENPVVLGTYGAYGCHDITFFGAPGSDKFRAYCAGIQRTEIWNMDGFNVSTENFGIELTTVIGCPVLEPGASGDVAAELMSCATDSPVVGSPVFGSSPARTLHHLAMVNNDASVLIIGDEFNGGGSPGACFGHVQGTPPSTSTPLGALWFYDISDEMNPVLLSWLTPPTVMPTPMAAAGGNPLAAVPNCTAHFGTVVPGEEKLVMAWYSAGILLVDFSNPADPVILERVSLEGGNMWDARIHHGYVFSGDILRGMDVYQLI